MIDSRHRPILIRCPRRKAWDNLAFIGMLSVSGFVLLAISSFENTALHRALLVAVVLAGVGLAALAWFWVRADAVKLSVDRIERIGLFHTQSLRLADIIGVRGGAYDFAMLATREGVRHLLLPRYAYQNAVVAEWVNGLPFLDLQEALADEARLEADPRLGTSVDSRRVALVRLRQVARVLAWMTAGVGLWALVFPRPYDLAIGLLAVLPIVALGLARWKPGLFTIVPTGRIEVSANLFVLIMGPCLVLGLRALLDIHLLDWVGPLAIAIPTTLLVGSLLWVVDANLRNLITGLFFALILLAGSWGGLVLGNARLDSGPAMIAPVRVIDTGDGDRPSVTVVLPAMYGGGRKTIPARWATVRAAKSGQSLCVLVHTGRFGWRYVHAVQCTFG